MKSNQRLYYALWGVTPLLAILIILKILLSDEINSQSNTIYNIFSFIYSYLINWKFFTIMCMLIGVKASQKQTMISPRKSYIKYVFLIIIVAVFALHNALWLILYFILLLSFVRIFYKKTSLLKIFIQVIFLSIAAILISLKVHPDIFIAQAFTELSNINLSQNSFIEIVFLLVQPPQLFGYCFGYIMMLLGVALGNTSLIKDYFFFYNELKKLFRLSLSLFVLWILLNQFNIYDFLCNYPVGKIVYILDGMVAQIITVYMFMFLLIYIENFKWGIKTLRLLNNIGMIIAR